MPIIHFYDATPEDEKHARAELAQAGELRFTAEPLTVDNADTDADFISIFVISQLNSDLIANSPKLKLVACRSTGFNNVDLIAAKLHSVEVVNVPSYGAHTVAEYTFAMLLALIRRLGEATDAFAAGTIDRQALRGIDLFGKTLGLIGTGHIGRNVAAIANGFGLKVVAFDAYPDAKWAEASGVTYSSLDAVLSGSDVITLHVPYSPELHHLLDENMLKLVRPTAIILNTARGELIDTVALLEALIHGQLGGVALDVFEGESLTDIHNEILALRHNGEIVPLKQVVELDIMRKLPNVLITNHNAFNTIEALERINQTNSDNILAFIKGSRQNSVIDK